MKLLEMLRHLRFEELALSDYSLAYINKMMPNIDYFFDIYKCVVNDLLETIGRPPETLTLVDYGGGHGFLSMYLKERGVRQVIYVDHNPKAVQAVTAVMNAVGVAPDVVLQGNTQQLKQWCMEHDVLPDGLLGLDVIEHIYCLDDFFCDLFTMAPALPMVFTTGSNPFNIHIVNRLRRVMVLDEQGDGKGQEGFFHLRRRYIMEHFPEKDDKELDYWAKNTRGLIYQDVQRAVESQSPNLLRDPFNTCDPDTGSWTERILSLEEYRGIVQPYGSDVYIENGFYNERSRKFGKRIRRFLNWLLRQASFTAIAPFIILNVRQKNGA